MHWLQSVAVRFVLSLILCCVIHGDSHADDQTAEVADELSMEPYVVFVAQEKAFTRCGPSDDYYHTDPLRRGQELEVYVETDDGWLGIRPPEDSFCWVPADAIEVDTSQEYGVVSEDRTVAWIGTHLGRARKYRWQVQLADGESVTVIGRSERDGPDGPQLWYRIVPPSGEFRWVHRDQVVDSAEKLVAASPRPAPSTQVEFLPAERDYPAGQSGSPIRRPAGSDVRTTSLDSSPSSGYRPGPAQLQPLSAREAPVLREAPERRTDTASAQAIDTASSRAIGSGVQNWQSNAVRGSVESSAANSQASQPGTRQSMVETMKDRGLLASVEFIGRPRLLDLGTNNAVSAPPPSEVAGDANWVTGYTREAPSRSIQQVGGQQPITPRYPTTSQPSVTNAHLSQPTAAPAQRTLHVVTAEQVARVDAEARGANVDRLSLILSRLMASRASAAEAEPVARQARTLASSSVDQVVAGRARLLAERVIQYQRVADRRDGSAVIRSGTTPAIPVGHGLPATATGQASLVVPTVPQPAQISQSGFLVQVYSARTNSPPFALTDHSGVTVAYVTPTPGVNLRSHLNSYVNVTGNHGYLQGMNTPHIMVTGARRSAE